MLFEGSVWYPNSKRSIAVVGLLVAMTALHFTELVGLTDAGLLFGWLPVQLAYDMGYTLVSVVLLYWIVTMAPSVPETVDETPAPSDETVIAEEVAGGEHDG